MQKNNLAFCKIFECKLGITYEKICLFLLIWQFQSEDYDFFAPRSEMGL